MKQSRRQFLKVASLSFLGFAGSSLVPGTVKKAAAASGQYKSIDKEVKAVQWGMVIDTRRFETAEDFEKVIKACHKPHNVPEIVANPKNARKAKANQEVKWLWTDGYTQTFTDQVDRYPSQVLLDRNYLLLCNHCEDPACTRVCPTRATFRRKDGIVVMDYHRCIGCRYCMAGCPYGARSFNFTDPRPYIDEMNMQFPTRSAGVVEKCNFCSERLAKGEMPYCVEASDGAIAFGDLADPESEVRKLLAENYTLRRKPTLGTEPSVYYII